MAQIPMKDALATLDNLQRDTFGYFWHEANPTHGLIADNTTEKAPASIASVGFALAAYAVGVECAYITRAEAVERILKTLRFFWNSPQQQAPDSTGWKGFYYHFLDMQTGQRIWKSEVSTIDTAYLLAGMLIVAQYFDQNSPDESELRSLAEALSRRVGWRRAGYARLNVR